MRNFPPEGTQSGLAQGKRLPTGSNLNLLVRREWFMPVVAGTAGEGEASVVSLK